MTSGVLGLVAGLLLAGVFGAAAIAKLRDRTGTLDAVGEFGVSSRLARPERRT